jgi:hypothetical protein
MTTYKFQVTDTSSYPGTQRTITKHLSDDNAARGMASYLQTVCGWSSVVWHKE